MCSSVQGLDEKVIYMAKVERFEDLRCWQAARDLVVLVYKCCQTGSLKRDFETKSQLKRAALLVMNNIAEGFSRYHRKEFICFLDFTQSSAAEVSSMLYVLSEPSYLKEGELINMRNKTLEAQNLTLALSRYKNSSSYVQEEVVAY